jgi:radical SAM superfamily enzyme YgiQ (UPF0313 family)
VINLIAINNSGTTGARCSATRILQDYLKSKNIETKVYDFWYRAISLTYENKYRQFGIVQEMPAYDCIIKALDGKIEDDESLIVPEIIKLANEIDVSDGTIFGFSTTVISHYFLILFALIVKKRNPKVITVFGGYHVSLGNIYADFLLKNNIADFVVKYDGCEPLYKIYTGEQKERYIIGNFIKDFWPKFDRIDAHLSHRTLSTVTSYGCNNGCYFCASDRKFVDCDMKKFEEYLKSMVQIGFENVELNDDNPNITEEKFKTILKIMETAGVKDWMSFVNPIVLVDKIPKGSNLKRVLIGAECFTDRIFKIVNKKQTVSQLLHAIDFYIENGVDVYSNQIVGFPGETEDDLKETIKIMEKLRNLYGYKINFWPIPFRIFPGSYMYNHPEQFGISYTYWNNTNIPKNFSVKDLTKENVDFWLHEMENNFPEKIIQFHREKKDFLITRK